MEVASSESHTSTDNEPLRTLKGIPDDRLCWRKHLVRQVVAVEPSDVGYLGGTITAKPQDSGGESDADEVHLAT